MIQQSPIKMIMFLAKYQGGNDEIINGIITFDDFILLLNNNNIMFNICYIIRE